MNAVKIAFEFCGDKRPGGYNEINQMPFRLWH
jgi:hypothetical protein